MKYKESDTTKNLKATLKLLEEWDWGTCTAKEEDSLFGVFIDYASHEEFLQILEKLRSLKPKN